MPDLSPVRGGANMSHLNVFRELAGRDSRIGFYTKETGHQIPAAGGCYAWFLPLWFYRDDLDALLSVIGELLSYDPDPEKTLDAPFNWERVGVRVRRYVDMAATSGQHEAWRRIIANDRARGAALFRRSLSRSFIRVYARARSPCQAVLRGDSNWRAPLPPSFGLPPDPDQGAPAESAWARFGSVPRRRASLDIRQPFW